MQKTKETKRAFRGSVVAVLLCVAMLIGTTFAWFTDTAGTAVNKIEAGTLKVALEMQDTSGSWVTAEGKTLQFKKAAENEPVLWEPGCTYELPALRIVNKGSLALKYKVAITGIQGSAKLNEVIDWTVNGADIGTEGHLTAGQETAQFVIQGHMQKNAGNEYQGETIDGIAITVVATQDTVESDSFGNLYDENAQYPVVAAGTVQVENGAVAQAAVIASKEKVATTNTPVVQAKVPAEAKVNDGVQMLKLTVDEAANPANFSITDFENAKTLEVKMEGLHPENTKLIQVELYAGTGLDNFKLFHRGVAMNPKYSLAGVTSDQDYYYSDSTGVVTFFLTSSFSPFTFVSSKPDWTNYAATEYSKKDEQQKTVTVASAAELAKLAKEVNSGTHYKGWTVQLAADIDLAQYQWKPIGETGKPFQGSFDGRGHTISNLLINKKWTCDIGLFGLTTNGEVKNFTLKNANVVGYLNVGAVAGMPYTSKYSNIVLTGTVQVNGYAYVGGMFGKNAYANLTDLTIQASAGSLVQANSKGYRTYIGGLVGFMGEGAQVVKNVTSNINVVGSTCDVGGITGIAHYGNRFENCHSSGNVTLLAAPDAGDELEIGGIAGVWHNQSGTTVTFTGCSYTGTLSSTNKTTGAVTKFENNGLVGRKYGDGNGTLIIE